MTGKTSLVKVSLAEIEKHKKNYQAIYLNLRGEGTLQALLQRLAEAINNRESALIKLRKLLSNIRSVQIGPAGLTIDRSSAPRSTLLSFFNALDHSGRKYVIALDEVQELASVSGQLLSLLANIFASYRNIKFVFTGSQIGLIKYLIEPPDSDSPLFGRPPARIRLRPFTREQSEMFLSRGLKECGSILARDQMDRVVSRLDGVVGWLTMFGNFYGIRGLSYSKALDETVKQGGKIAFSELDNFLKGRHKPVYMAVLKTAKLSGSLGNSWTELKAGAETRLKRSVNNKTLTSVIHSLLGSEMLEEFEGRYRILDPLLREAL